MGNRAFDVAIVGYGPTGMVAASLLGRLGHRVVVFERWTSLYGLPRITHIDDETARTIQAAGDIDVALADTSPTGYTWVNGDGQQLLEIPVAPMAPTGYPSHISVYQPDIEQAIHEQIQTFDNVEFRPGWLVTGLQQSISGVDLDVAPWDPSTRSISGDTTTTSARYVIAADGSRSSIRSHLGVEREDFGFNERWLNVDTEWVVAPRSDLEGTHQICDPARGRMTMRIGNRRQRFEFALLDGESDATMQEPETAWKFLEMYFGVTEDQMTIARQLVYQFEARIAHQWRVGDVFLTGDAAHTMPPYLGQGACSGIRDATNLAWKLDLVLRDKASDALLDIYEQERRPNTTEIVQTSVFLGMVANMHDPVEAAERDAGFLAGGAPPPPEFAPISAGVVGPAPGGTLTPQGRVTIDGRTGRLDDLVGYGFCLVCRTQPEVDPASAAIVDRFGIAIVGLDAVHDHDAVHTAHLDQLGAFAYLARPDQVLFGTANDAGDVGRLLADLADAIGPVP
jgi:3-(3-hydroxy-phenyl)propionate hydroxylase